MLIRSTIVSTFGVTKSYIEWPIYTKTNRKNMTTTSFADSWLLFGGLGGFDIGFAFFASGGFVDDFLGGGF